MSHNPVARGMEHHGELGLTVIYGSRTNHEEIILCDAESLLGTDPRQPSKLIFIHWSQQ